MHAGAAVEYNLRWPGHYFDAETGLHYNRYRYYDPGLGRYLTQDPTGYQGSDVNLYAYCSNPLVQVDVLGLHPIKDDPNDGESTPTRVTDPEHPGGGDGAPRTRRQLSSEEAARIQANLDAKAAHIIAEMDAAHARGERTLSPDALPEGVTAPHPLNTKPGNDPVRSRGPCLSLTQDLDTGRIYVTQNRSGKPENPHPLTTKRINDRVTSNQENFNYTNDGWKAEGRTRSGRPGTHSEVHGANQALNDRAALNQTGDHPPGRPHDESDMDGLVIHNTRTETGGAGQPMTRCHNCGPITDGAHALHD